MSGISDPSTIRVDDVEEVTGGDQCDHFDVERRNFRVVQCFADECLYGLSHGVLPP